MHSSTRLVARLGVDAFTEAQALLARQCLVELLEVKRVAALVLRAPQERLRLQFLRCWQAGAPPGACTGGCNQNCNALQTAKRTRRPYHFAILEAAHVAVDKSDKGAAVFLLKRRQELLFLLHSSFKACCGGLQVTHFAVRLAQLIYLRNDS